MSVVQGGLRTGTDGDFAYAGSPTAAMGGVTMGVRRCCAYHGWCHGGMGGGYADVSVASVWRTNRTQAAARVDALSSGGMDDLEIPAFLRKQADYPTARAQSTKAGSGGPVFLCCDSWPTRRRGQRSGVNRRYRYFQDLRRAAREPLHH